MRGLDRTAEELERFHRALQSFDDQLRQSTRELGEIEEQMAKLWDDAFRREFEARRADVAKPVDDYLKRGGERYLRFIADRRASIRRYLGGV